MILQGRGISKGKGAGSLVLSSLPVSFLGGVNPADGTLAGGDTSISGKIFAFPRGRGSTVGSYTMLEMKRRGTLPAAIINQTAEPIVATGAVMAGVPLVDQIDLSLLREGDQCLVDGDEGTVELPLVQEIKVVTALLTFGEKILLLKRSDKVGSFQRHWAGVSGYIEREETPLECALKEIEEEVGFTSPRLVKQSEPLVARSEKDIWIIHPFLFEVDDEAVRLDWEHTEYKWLEAEEVMNHETVPGIERVLASLGLKKE